MAGTSGMNMSEEQRKKELKTRILRRGFDGKSREGRGRRELEHCVCCNRELEVTKDTDICRRKFYIEGAGQLCPECYYEIYNH